MNVLGFSEVRARFGEVLDTVVADHVLVVVARRGGDAVVLISLSDWRAREDAEHLLSNPNNAQRLVGAIDELNAISSAEDG